MIQAVLFDLDGLLVDTETLCLNISLQVCKELNLTVSKEEMENAVGVTAKKFYGGIIESRKSNLLLDEVIKKHCQVYEEALMKEVKPFDGALSLPKSLKSQGIKTAIVSGSNKKQIEIVLNSISIREDFELIVSCDDIKHSKPNPEGYIQAAQKFNLNPNECLVLEDSTNGIKAGKAAGMVVVGVVNIGGQDLSLADFVINDLTELNIEQIEKSYSSFITGKG